MNLANNIKSVVRSHGMTITQLSERLGILQPQLSRTINSPRVSLEDLNRIAAAIGCNVQDFFLEDIGHSVDGRTILTCPKCGARLTVTPVE